MTITRELCILRSMEHGFNDDLTQERLELTLNLVLRFSASTWGTLCFNVVVNLYFFLCFMTKPILCTLFSYNLKYSIAI